MPPSVPTPTRRSFDLCRNLLARVQTAKPAKFMKYESPYVPRIASHCAKNA